MAQVVAPRAATASGAPGAAAIRERSTRRRGRGRHLDRWDAADDKRRTGQPVDAEVTEANRGGLIVRLLGLRAFLPASQVATHAAADWTTLVGQQILVEVLEVNRRRNRV